MSSGPLTQGHSRRWPEPGQFNEAVQNLATTVSDAELQTGEPQLNALGLPMPYAGNFADVYKVHCPKSGNTWAVKFFKREVRDLREHYRAISEHLIAAQLPFMVDFRYFDEGVRIGGNWFPLVKMRWIEGISLSLFVAQSLASQPKMLDLLFTLWVKLAARLRISQMAHADLQHGNVVLVPEGEKLLLKLIDYDGMFVPALAGMPSGELGHANYQHPQREITKAFNAELDRFSHLAICCALRCLRVGGLPLWERYNNDENLLFKAQDFCDPANSPLFRELWMLRDPAARALVGRLALATQRPLEQTPLIEEMAQDGRVRPLEDHEQREVQQLFRTDERTVVPAPSDSSAATEATAVVAGSQPTLATRPPAANRPIPLASPNPADDDTAGTKWNRKPKKRRGSAGPFVGIVRNIDVWLSDIAGDDNPLLHNYFRLVLLLVCLAVPSIVIWLAAPTVQDRWRQYVAAQELAGEKKVDKANTKAKKTYDADDMKADDSATPPSDVNSETEENDATNKPEESKDDTTNLIVEEANDSADPSKRILPADTTTRVTVDSNGAEGNGDSGRQSLSADGRFVAFHSSATNLVGGDTNNAIDVFLRDLQTGTTTLVSVDGSGAGGNGNSYTPSISADGRYVVFESGASNLVAGDTNNKWDIFVRDLQSNTVTRVSVDSSGIESNEDCFAPAISADGRYVALHSRASNLVPGDTNGTPDIFVRDVKANTTARASVSSTGAQASSSSEYPSLSADGRYVAFSSNSSNVVPGDTNDTEDVFVRDLQTNTTTRVNVDRNGTQANEWSAAPVISADGRYVAFQSKASNLVSGDANEKLDVFLRDLQTNTTTRVSIDSSGTEANGDSQTPAISAHGRYVAFISRASNLVPGDTNRADDIFVRDLQTNTTRRVSVDGSGTQTYSDLVAAYPTISADGRLVAFTSGASALVPEDRNNRPDVFVRSLPVSPDSPAGDSKEPSSTTSGEPIRPPGTAPKPAAEETIIRVSVDDSGVQGNRESSKASISADGRHVAFLSDSTNLVTGGTNGLGHIFVRNMRTNTITRASVDSDGTEANASSGPGRPSLSANGRFVAFASYASNLVPGDTNGEIDVFVHDLQANTTIRASIGSNGKQANEGSFDPSLSGDGRYAAFMSGATLLVANGDTNRRADIFMRDLQNNTTTRVSVDSGGAQANGESWNPSFSADSRYVSFSSSASNLVPGDTNRRADIFVRDLQNNTLTLVRAESNPISQRPSLSADGRYVVFCSAASNLVARDTNEVDDIFVHDLQSKITTRVSLDSNGAQGNSLSLEPSISADGRYVAFVSHASNLVANDNNRAADVFVHDTKTGATARVSAHSGGVEGNGESTSPSISADGRYIVFTSKASNLVPGDTNDATDVFRALNPKAK